MVSTREPDSSANSKISGWSMAAAADFEPPIASLRTGCLDFNNLVAPAFWRHSLKRPAGSDSGCCFDGSLSVGSSS